MNTGDNVNGYIIEKHIKDGGMGSVFRVKKNGSFFALKTLSVGANNEDVLRFLRETRMLQKVKDENVIEVLDYGFDGAIPYYIMPYCSESLTDLTPRLSFDERLEACISFCKGILAIHHAGICHRDIKPDNALYLNGILKITDLGGGRFFSRDTTTLTHYGDAIYTPGYMPPEYNTDPEAFRNGTRQGDIYMIGKSVYYVMSGGGDVSNVDLANVDPGAAPIIERCLMFNLNDRYNNVEDIIEELSIFKNARMQLQQVPKTLQEILNEHGQAKNDDLFNLLLIESSDEQTLYTLLIELDDKTLTDMLIAKNSQLNNYIGLYDRILRNPKGWIQFNYIEVYVNFIMIMFSQCHTIYYKQKLLDLAFDLAIQYNRYPAMLIIGTILNSLSESDARGLGPFFVRRKADILHMRPNFNQPMHYIVRNLVN